ncbi:SAM-dependent DNA methyltransferase [Escherichia coli]|nr:SAM-dependent DNA methyltransferase [Escherichia coli]
MNKQQIAAKIWESANQMRSKIEVNEYKDYILGFIFYKYLSDQLVRFVTRQGDDTRSRIVVHRTVKTYLKS